MERLGIRYYIPLLDDADCFLNQARGLPEVASAKPNIDRFLRASILLSWVALEEALEYVLEEKALGGAAPAKPFRSRLDFALSALGRPPVPGDLFTFSRKLRNQLTHPISKSKITAPSVDDATKVFRLCAGLIRNLSKYEIIWHLDGPPGPRTLRERLRFATDRRLDDG